MRSYKLRVLLIPLFQALSALGLSHLALSASLDARERPLTVYGWPLTDNDPTKVWLNQDAIMGTYVCPSLTRLNLAKEMSERVLLQSLASSGKEWTLSLKTGLKWWDGKAADAKDLETFLIQELPGLVKKVGSDQWESPSFTTKIVGANVVLTWETAPAFGPYLLNRIPFFKRNGSEVVCVGSLLPQKAASTKALAFSGAIGGKDRELLLSQPLPNTAPAPTDDSIAFRFGDELHPPTYERQIEEELSCPLAVDLPVMTMIAWNPEGPYTRNEEFRKAMTSIMPRGALLRAGAGSLGDLISAPILRAHPGYKKSLLVLPYDFKKADAILNRMDLPRSAKDGYRRSASGDVIEIVIATDKQRDSSLLRKILDDSFRAQGIMLRIVSNPAKADGMLVGIDVNWPENDLAPILHSKRSGRSWPWAYNFPEIDEALGRYNLSLTEEKPDFERLVTIHDLIYKREPFSVLVQHKSCMQYGKGMTSPKVVSIRNPDWMRSLLER